MSSTISEGLEIDWVVHGVYNGQWSAEYVD